MDSTTIVATGVGIILGWALKAIADRWNWRRQQLLDAYIQFLESVDRFTLQVTRVWREGRDISKRQAQWVALAEDAREAIAAVDRADGKLRLVARWEGAQFSMELYIACERMFRRAIVDPPCSADRYREATEEMVRRFDAVVTQGRNEMGLLHWREHLPRRKSLFDLTQQRLDELDKTDPVPGKKPGA